MTKKEKVKFHYNVKSDEIPTGTCLILVTPDSERTMCTFLGTAGRINENDLNIDLINSIKLCIENILFSPVRGLILLPLKLNALGEKCIPLPTQN